MVQRFNYTALFWKNFLLYFKWLLIFFVILIVYNIFQGIELKYLLIILVIPIILAILGAFVFYTRSNLLKKRYFIELKRDSFIEGYISGLHIIYPSKTERPYEKVKRIKTSGDSIKFHGAYIKVENQKQFINEFSNAYKKSTGRGLIVY